MGSPTGDGAIEALQGKADAAPIQHRKARHGLGHSAAAQFPAAEDQPMVKGRVLLIDGPFTNAGLAALAGLDGVFDLDLFWHVDHITTDGFAHLLAPAESDGRSVAMAS